MPENTVTIPVEEYRSLLFAAREGDMLKALIREKEAKYQRLEHSELEMLMKLFGIEKKESEE